MQKQQVNKLQRLEAKIPQVATVLVDCLLSCAVRQSLNATLTSVPLWCQL